jgi:hypothetical protein
MTTELDKATPSEQIEALKTKLTEHLHSEFGDAYDCTRVWEAWDVGTMGEDDFEPLNARLDSIVLDILQIIGVPYADLAQGIIAATAVNALGSGQGDAVAGEDVPRTETLKIYRHDMVRHDAYLSARFPAEGPHGLSFEFEGHRWAYYITGFDDGGDYDVLRRHLPLGAPYPPAASARISEQTIEAAVKAGLRGSAVVGGWDVAIERITENVMAALAGGPK